jgi:hypothetical protein
MILFRFSKKPNFLRLSCNKIARKPSNINRQKVGLQKSGGDANSYHQPIFVSHFFGDKCCLVFRAILFSDNQRIFCFLKNEKEFLFNQLKQV